MCSIWEEDTRTWENHLQRTRKNLGMTKQTIERDVNHLKTWLKTHSYLPSLTEVDETRWLENYLLLNKNDVERAKKNLDLYFRIHNLLPEGYVGRSPQEADMNQSFKTLCLAITPKLTDDGKMVVVFQHLTNRPSDYQVIPFAKRMINMIDIHLRTGIHRSGTILVMDLRNAKVGHLARYQPLRLVKAFFSQVWSAYPERVAQIHIINPPIVLHAGLVFFRPFLKEKMKKRIMVHSNLDSLYEYVPKSHLPKDYGGECADKIELNWRWEKLMLEHEGWLNTCAEKHKISNEKWPLS